MINWSKFIGCPQHAKPAMRGMSSVDLPTLDSVARSGWVVSVTPRPLCRQERDPIPIVKEAERAWGRSGQVQKISSPHRSETLHRSFFKTHTNSSVTRIKAQWSKSGRIIPLGKVALIHCCYSRCYWCEDTRCIGFIHRPLLNVILIHNVPILMTVKRLCDQLIKEG
jgi:hypothetical protein